MSTKEGLATMSHPATSKPPAANGGLDFEITDLATAREALDNESLAMAAQAARPIDPREWIARRRPGVPTDRALAGTTIEWLLRLPDGARPHKLCEKLPRLANRIASVWSDPVECVAAIEDLLVDRRGGRRGLPLELRLELQALREFRSAVRS
jgi:hypothetical protein